MNSLQKKNQRALDRLEKQRENEIIRNYQLSLKELRGKIAELYEKTDGNFAEAQKYKRLTKLEKEIAREIGKLTGKNAQTLKKGMMDVYEESYYRTAFFMSNEVQADLGFAMLQREVVEEAIQNPLDRVGFLERNRDNQQRLTRQLREQLTQALVQGESYRSAAKRIKERMDVGASNALTIARTENHRVRQKARHESMKEGERIGVSLSRTWLATVGDRTRDAHGEADGQTVGIDEPFDVGGEELMFPGDPAGSPENVIQCRCDIIENVDGMNEPNTRRVKGIGVTEYRSFNEFKKEGLIPNE